MEKQKIKLTQEKETLLVPLLAKAMENAKEHPILKDAKAEEILRQIEYEFKDLGVPRQTLITLAMRAKRLDEYVQDYLARAEHPLVLHLGCGLDSRVLRAKASSGRWYDLDYPDVIELRKKFYNETNHYSMIPSSVTDLGWLQTVKESGPACILAEGLLMYLHETQVRELLENLQERFPGSEIAFDAYSHITASSVNRHPSIKKTGALVHWGIDKAEEIAAWGSGFKLLEEWYFTDSPDIPCLGGRDRFMFQTMGLFNAAKKAHRILRFQM